MRIACVQFKSLDEADDNIEKTVRFIEQEAGRSDLIIFPELFLNCKHPEHAPYLVTMFSMLSKAHKIDIVPGSMLTKRNGKVYNTTYYISRGRVVAKYDKTNLWKSERRLGKGRGPRAFKTRFGRTALIICWDLASPHIAADLSKMNLDLIICPSMWWEGSEAKSEKRFAGDFVDALCCSRAYESRAALAYANAAGVLKLSSFSDISTGRTQIVVPMSQSTVTDSRYETVVRLDIKKGAIKSAKRYLG